MVTLDDQVTIVSIGFILLVVFNMVVGVSYEFMLAPFNRSIVGSLIGVDLWGIDNMILISAVILYFESHWHTFGNLILGLLVFGLIWLLTVFPI
ncbi:hypothetical protein KJ765_04830 [Candidatus Micrarchaeota archaeon]|nr:hypothetical protein [Candidatus Micrarchaeota archaeon]